MQHKTNKLMFELSILRDPCKRFMRIGYKILLLLFKNIIGYLSTILSG